MMGDAGVTGHLTRRVLAWPAMTRTAPAAIAALAALLVAGCQTHTAGTAVGPTMVTRTLPESVRGTATGQPSPSPAPPQDDDGYLAALARRAGVPVTSLDGPKTIRLGRMACTSLDGGHGYITTLSELVKEGGNVWPVNAAYIIGAATEVYCPQNKP